jgi:hypothetical protein
MNLRIRRLVTFLTTAALVAAVGLVLAPSASAAAYRTAVYTIPPKYALSTTAVKFGGTVYPALGQKVTVQRRDGKKWVTVDTARVSTSSARFTSSYRVRPGTKSFRLVVAKTSRSTSVVQKWTSRTTDGKKYRSYIARARSYMKAYCPRTPIFVNTNLVNSRYVGMATDQYYWTGSTSSSARRYTWQHQIHLEPGLPKAVLRHVALHECAHVVQFRRLVKGPEARAKADRVTAKVFTKRSGEYGDGNERQADCMAIVITRKPQYGGYTQSCNAARTKSAKALWKAYGKKYQSSVYSFTLR